MDETGIPPQAAAPDARTRRQLMRELDQVNRELNAFISAISHDLRAPLRSISGFSKLLMDEYGDKLDDGAKGYLRYVTGGTQRMSELIEDLIRLAQITTVKMAKQPVSITALALEIAAELKSRYPGRSITVEIADGLIAHGDARLVTVALEQLLGNAWKFTSGRADTRIVVGSLMEDDTQAFYVRDNGAGFDMHQADRLFAPFQRLHSENEFEGRGIGLAIVQRVVARHGGRIWVEAEEHEGATFYFTLGDAPDKQ